MPRRFFLLPFFSLLLQAQLLRAQAVSPQPESLLLVRDSLVRSDLACFTVKGRVLRSPDTAAAVPPEKIPLAYGDEKLAYFQHPKRIGLYVHLYFKNFDSAVHRFSRDSSGLVLIDGRRAWGADGRMPQRQVDSIFFVLHSHWLRPVPREAYAGLFEPALCRCPAPRRWWNKREGCMTPYYSMYWSADRKRLYVYMRGGRGKDAYEVTWVMTDGRYCCRVVDAIDP